MLHRNANTDDVENLSPTSYVASFWLSKYIFMNFRENHWKINNILNPKTQAWFRFDFPIESGDFLGSNVKKIRGVFKCCFQDFHEIPWFFFVVDVK